MTDKIDLHFDRLKLSIFQRIQRTQHKMTTTNNFVNNIISQLEQYRDGDGVFNISKDGSTTGEEILRDIVDSSERPKRPASGYFLWLNANRQKIKETYFSDYDQVKNWDMDSKKTYYLEKGLKWKDDAKEGKPKIVALVTSKAGIMWKALSEEETKEYMDKSLILKDEYSMNIKKFNEINEKVMNKKIKKAPSAVSSSKKDTPKKGRGRPMKVKKEVNVVTEVMVDKSEDTAELDVTEEIINGKTYYLEEASGQLYDPETGDSVGEKCDDGTYKWN